MKKMMEKLGIFAEISMAAAGIALGDPLPYRGGTDDGDYTIETLEQLRAFEEAVHYTSFEESTFTLIADIDCEGGAFTANDATVGSVFKGTFDGGGHVIGNFVNAGAMFDIVRDGAVIKNLTLEGTFSRSRNLTDYAGSFAGKVIGKADGRPVIFENSFGKGKAVYFAV